MDDICACGNLIEQPARGRRRKKCLTCAPRNEGSYTQFTQCIECGTRLVWSKDKGPRKWCSDCLPSIRDVGRKAYLDRRAQLLGYADHADWMKAYRTPERRAAYNLKRNKGQKPCQRCQKPILLTNKNQGVRYCTTCRIIVQAERVQAREYPPGFRQVIYERDNYVCQLCLGPCLPGVHHNHRLAPTLDHIIPLSAGGEPDLDNLWTAHRICNTIKQDRIVYRGAFTQPSMLKELV